MSIEGIVYKIIHLDSNLCYVGSTCDSLRGRWRAHKSGYKKWLSNKDRDNPVAIFPYFEQYGIDRFKMILIKSYDIVDKKHLYVYEQLAINRTKCVNKQCAFQLSTKLWMKNYYENNKEKIKEKSKNYYENNKEELLKKQKEYKLKNKEKNDKILKEIINCECGKTLTKQSLKYHLKSNKHIKFIQSSP